MAGADCLRTLFGRYYPYILRRIYHESQYDSCRLCSAVRHERSRSISPINALSVGPYTLERRGKSPTEREVERETMSQYFVARHKATEEENRKATDERGDCEGESSWRSAEQTTPCRRNPQAVGEDKGDLSSRCPCGYRPRQAEGEAERGGMDQPSEGTTRNGFHPTGLVPRIEGHALSGMVGKGVYVRGGRPRIDPDSNLTGRGGHRKGSVCRRYPSPECGTCPFVMPSTMPAPCLADAVSEGLLSLAPASP